jgi:hypothetical protein
MQRELQKIGVKVDKDVYDDFVKWVIEKHGKKRGVLGTELTNAMDAYMDNEPVSNRDILDAIESLEIEPSLSDGEGTHTR